MDDDRFAPDDAACSVAIVTVVFPPCPAVDAAEYEALGVTDAEFQQTRILGSGGKG